jgi:hypothetical protein
MIILALLFLLFPTDAEAVMLAIPAAVAAASAAGAAAAGLAASTVMTVASIAWTVGSLIASQMFPPKPQQIGPRLTDLDVTSSAFGEPVRDSWGTIALPGLLVDASKLKEKKHKAGGKGIFGGGPSGFFYTYSLDAAWMFRRREAAGILRIWMGPKLVRNVPEGVTIEEILASNFPFNNGGLKIYVGSEDQLPDPTLEALHGVGNVPAYRGIVYIVVTDFQLADYGNQVPPATAEVFDNGGESLQVFPRWSATAGLGMAWITKQSWNYIDDNGEAVLLVTDTNFWAEAFTTYGSNTVNSPYAYYYVRATPNGIFPETKILNPSDPIWDRIPHTAGAGQSDVPAFLETAADGFHLILYNEGREIFMLPPPGSFVASPSSWTYTNGKLLLWFNSGWGSPLGVLAEYSPAGFFMRYSDSLLPYPGVIQIRESNSFLYALESQQLSNLFGGPSSRLFKLDRDSLEVLEIWELGVSQLASFSVVNDEKMYFVQTGHGFGTVNFYRLKDKQCELIGTVGNVFGVNFGAGQLIFKNSVFFYGPQNGDIYPVALVFNEDCVPLSEVVAGACKYALIPQSRFDVSELTDCLRGYQRDRTMTWSDFLKPLLVRFLFDAVESGAILKFPKRNRPVSLTLTKNDLGAFEPGQEPPDLLATSEIHERKLPTFIRVRYLQKEKDYEQGEQHDERLITDYANDVDVNLPIVMTADEAKRTAQTLLPLMWTERHERKIVLTRKFIQLEPSDVIEVTL